MDNQWHGNELLWTRSRLAWVDAACLWFTMLSPTWKSEFQIQAMDRVPMGGDGHYFLCMTCCMTSLATHRRPLLHWEPKQALTWQVHKPGFVTWESGFGPGSHRCTSRAFWSCAVRFVPQFNTSMCWVYLLILHFVISYDAKLQCMVLYQIIS